MAAGDDWPSGSERGFVVQWNGTDWTELSGPGGTGVDAAALTLQRFDEGSGDALFAGGEFTQAGGVAVNGLAQWNGSAWGDVDSADFTRGYHFLGDPPVIRTLRSVERPGVNSLYLSGDFVQVDEIPARDWVARNCAVPLAPEIFSDDFESGGTSAWSNTVQQLRLAELAEDEEFVSTHHSR